jgi:DNA-binding IclR family transcriptional regulator
VGRDHDSLEFSVGPALLALAAQAGAPDLVSSAMPVLERLGAVTGERVDLAVLHDGQVLTIESIASSSTVQAVGWVGRRTPLHCTAAGRVLLAPMTAAEVTALVGSSPFPTGGPNGPRSRAELMRRIDAARRDGWALADGELDSDVTAIAAPISAADGRTRAAVAVSGPSFRMRSAAEGVVAAVCRAAAEVSRVGA